MSSSDTKIREAQEHLQEAEKALATGWFKRKPDHEEAAVHFEAAAKAFQFAKRFGESKEAFLKAATAHYNSESYYMSGKALESAASILQKDLKVPEEAGQVYTRAAQIFLENNQADRAIEMHEKCAKCLETSANPSLAVKSYKEALDLYENEDRLRLSLETFAKLMNLQLQLNDINGAIQTIDRTVAACVKIGNKHIMSKQCLSSVILLCSMGNEVGAQRRFDEYCATGFAMTDEGKIATLLLEGFEKRDQALIEEAVKKQHVTFLDNNVIKVARSLKVIGAELGSGGSAAAAVNPEQSTLLCDDPGATAPAAPEESNDLC